MLVLLLLVADWLTTAGVEEADDAELALDDEDACVPAVLLSHVPTLIGGSVMQLTTVALVLFVEAVAVDVDDDDDADTDEEAAFMRGNICSMSTSGSLIKAKISVCACLVASLSPFIVMLRSD